MVLFSSKVLAQDLIDFTDFKITPEIVRTATLYDGVKASFCPVDLGISGHELLAAELDKNFKLPDTIKNAPCNADPEDVILATVSVEFTKPVQNQDSFGFLFILFRNHLFQQNGHGNSFANYPNAPESFNFNYLNGGEEGNTPPFEDPKWVKYERDSNFLEMDSSSQEGFKTNPDTGYILHFDPNGKRQDFLFIFEGKVFKLIHAEKKAYNTLLIDYSQASPSAEPSITESKSK